MNRIEELENEVKRLTEERAHWKANHDEQVRMKRVTADYRDGFATELDHAEAENERLRALLAAKDDEIAEVLPMINGVLNTAIAIKAPAADCELLRRWRDAARTALGATQDG